MTFEDAPPTPVTSAAAPLYSPMIERALRFAAAAHEQQTRKGGGVPYITHPAGVALILVRAGWNDENVLAAAILHDVVEDTGRTLCDLRRDFPAKVVDLVACLSETKRDAAGDRPWEVRKREHIAELRAASTEACAIALADKLHNLETMLEDLETGEIRFENFNAPPERLLWYYEAMTSAACRGAEVRPLADACRAAIERLRRVVAEHADAVRPG